MPILSHFSGLENCENLDHKFGMLSSLRTLNPMKASASADIVQSQFYQLRKGVVNWTKNQRKWNLPVCTVRNRCWKKLKAIWSNPGGTLRCWIYIEDLHPRYMADAGRGSENNGKLYAAGHVKVREKQRNRRGFIFGGFPSFPEVFYCGSGCGSKQKADRNVGQNLGRWKQRRGRGELREEQLTLYECGARNWNGRSLNLCITDKWRRGNLVAVCHNT